MKVYLSKQVDQLYVIPSIKVTYSRFLNGDLEVVFGWFNRLLVIAF